MRRLTALFLLALSAVALLAVAPGVASAAKKGPKPKITRVSPMRISVGRLLTIHGRHFAPKRKGNTVIFRAPNGRTAFAKPRRASRKKLVVRVPGATARLLTVAGSQQKPTRLKLRVLAGRRFSKYTSRRLSPVVTGIDAGDGGGGGSTAKVCKDDADHDDDLLANDLEKQLGTDPCIADTDGDVMVDGWEYYAAKDLNIKAVPYPGRRPFPNALDPSDGSVGGSNFSAYDFDGDGLTTHEEFRAWRRAGGAFDPARAGGLDLESPLGYSDGTKYSRSGEVPSVPAWRGPSYGLPAPAQPFPATYNFYGDPLWRDSERDADADGLANWFEASRGPSQNSWWAAFFASDQQFSPPVQPWSAESYCGYRFGHFDQRPFAELNLTEGDVDGDTLLDGEDDQDNDDVNNVLEVYESTIDVDGNGNPAFCGYPVGMVPTIDFFGTTAPINPYNPCAPNPDSRTCPPNPL